MRTGYIRQFTLPRPDGGESEFFEIVELIGGLPHVTSEGWETQRTREAAEREAAARQIEIVDGP